MAKLKTYEAKFITAIAKGTETEIDEVTEAAKEVTEALVKKGLTEAQIEEVASRLIR